MTMVCHESLEGNKEVTVLEGTKVGNMVLFQIKEALEKSIIGKVISTAKIREEKSWHIVETTQKTT